MPQIAKTPLKVPALMRLPLRQLSFARLLRGGRLGDLGRLPRYAGIFAVGAVCIWAPIYGYLSTAPLRYTSSFSLILPGSGASASVNLDSIGQASSFANSPFASSSVSPTETYKRLLAAERIVVAAAQTMSMQRRDFGQPRVELVDQTGLIHVSIVGGAPEDARARGEALLASFFAEIEALRADEATTREISAGAAIEEYRNSVLATREEISRLQRDNGLISTSQYEALVAETDALAQRVRDLDATLQDRTNAVRALESSLGLTPRLAAAALRLHADIEFAALVKEMSERAADLSQARSKYGEAHPEVLTAREGHEAASAEARRRAAMLTGLTDTELSALDLSHVGNRAALLSDLVTSESQRAGLAAELAALTERLRTAEARRVELIEPAARLEDLQRDFAVAEAVFASAMARSQTTKTDLYASYPLVQVLEDPSLPVDPTSPKRKLAAVAGIAATVFLLIGLTLGWIRRPLIDRLLAKDDHDLVMVPAE